MGGDAALLRVHDGVPVPARGVGDGRRVPGQERPRDVLEHPPSLPAPVHRRVLGRACAISLVTAAARLRRRPVRRLRGDPGGHAALDPLGADDVLGRRGELRRHPARVRVHRDARAARRRHDLVPERRLRHERALAALPALHRARSRGRLPLLPAAADDPRDRARDRRAAQGMARGGRRTSARRSGSSGATSASRC